MHLRKLSKGSEYSSTQVLIPLKEAQKRSLKFYCELFLNLFSKYPYAVGKYKSGLMTKSIAEREPDFDIVVCDFLAPSINWIRATKKNTKSLLFQHNVEGVDLEKITQNSDNCLTRKYFKNQWQRMMDFEKNVSARFGGVVGVSDDDCRIMRENMVLKCSCSVPLVLMLNISSPMDARLNKDLFCFSVQWIGCRILMRFNILLVQFIL
jgi:hypothetical protein